jgi:hypothetical protein
MLMLMLSIFFAQSVSEKGETDEERKEVKARHHRNLCEL